MRPRSFLPIFAILALGLLSCKKQNDEPSLIGRWQLTEIFQTPVGGPSGWQPVTLENAEILEFDLAGSYSLRTNAGGNFQVCNGTYLLQNVNVLLIQSSCQTSQTSSSITQLDANTLILDRQGFDSVIRFKYKRLR